MRLHVLETNEPMLNRKYQVSEIKIMIDIEKLRPRKHLSETVDNWTRHEKILRMTLIHAHGIILRVIVFNFGSLRFMEDR